MTVAQLSIHNNVWEIHRFREQCSRVTPPNLMLAKLFIYSHVLCGWIAGHESEYMESLPEQEVRYSVTELIRTFTGESQPVAAS